MYDDFYQPGPFEEHIEEFIEDLRSSVKDDIVAELTRLRTDNRDLRAKLTNLDALERAATLAKSQYEVSKERAQRSALQEVRKLKAAELLADLCAPMFTISRTTVLGEKCDACDEYRYVSYLSPRGNAHKERCVCADVMSILCVVVEVMAVSVEVRDGKRLLWHVPSKTKTDDWSWRTTLYKNPSGVSDSTLCGKYAEYGFSSVEDAQRIVDLLNAESSPEAVNEW